MSDTLVEAPPIPPVTSTGGEMDHDGRNGKFATDNVSEDPHINAAAVDDNSPAQPTSPPTAGDKIEVSTPHDLVHDNPVVVSQQQQMEMNAPHLVDDIDQKQLEEEQRQQQQVEHQQQQHIQDMETVPQEEVVMEHEEVVLPPEGDRESELDLVLQQRHQLERMEMERQARQMLHDLERGHRGGAHPHQMGGHIPEVVSAVNSISEPETPPPTAASPAAPQHHLGPQMGHVLVSEEHMLRMQQHQQMEVRSPVEMRSPPGEQRPNSPQKIEVTTPHGNLQLTQEQIQAITEAGCREGQYFCTLCQKKFGYKNGLIRHIRLTHVGEKPYECNICQRRFGYKHILMEHQNLHFGNRPYACTQCDKRFAARSNLIQHRMVHKRPFNCQLCNKRFDREDQLKKHMFAHPQAMLQCNVCRYSAQTQADLNKHMVEKHNPQVMDTRLPINSGGAHLPGRRSVDHTNGLDQVQEGNPAAATAAEMYPVSESPNVASNVEVASSTHDTETSATITPPVQHSPISYSIRDQGSRVDKICNQLSASAAMTQMHDVPGFVQAGAPHGDNVMVKKEEGEEEVLYRHGDGSADGSPAAQPGHLEQRTMRHLSAPQPEITPQMAALQQAVMLERQMSTPNGVMTQQQQPVQQQQGSPQQQQMSSMAQAHPQTVSQLSTQPGVTPMSIAAALAAIKNAEAQAAIQAHSNNVHQPPNASTLPGIHEVFGKPKLGQMPGMPSTPMQQQQPGFPLAPQHIQAGLTEGGHELPLNMLSPPGTMPPGFPGNNPGVLGGGPRVPLPTPGASSLTQLVKGSRDAGVQYNAPIPDFPTLDDVINYYVGQGILFRCQHCSILFFERGMFFLHASLHGTNSPWECSICHKQMNDRNEFTLHFVNQKHN